MYSETQIWGYSLHQFQCMRVSRCSNVCDNSINNLKNNFSFSKTALLKKFSLVKNLTRMWANAQRDGRAAYYWWRRLFNAAVWLTPTIKSAVQ